MGIVKIAKFEVATDHCIVSNRVFDWRLSKKATSIGVIVGVEEGVEDEEV